MSLVPCVCVCVCLLADSSNAAEVAQAAIMQSQQKRLKHGVTTAQSATAVLSAAAVMHHSVPTATVPSEYQQYRELLILCYSRVAATQLMIIGL